jgi:outer membrane protein
MSNFNFSRKKMIMKRILITTFSAIAVCMTPLTYATSLVDAFQAALQSDSSYKQSAAQYASDKTQIEQARAGVLPKIDLQANYSRMSSDTSYNGNFPGAGPNSKGTVLDRGFNLTVTQPLFDLAAFKQLAQAKATVQQSAATYAASGQALIIRLATAYFNVLEAQDILRFSEAQRNTLLHQYEVAQQRYRVGLDAITALYKSRAAYDAAKAEYLVDENNLSNRSEELREITGVYYSHLRTLKDDFPLISPNPKNINQWVKTALEQNLALRATRFGVMAAQENIKVQSAGYLPTLDATGSISDDHQKNMSGPDGVKDNRSGNLGVALDFPVYNGGLTGANTDRAEAQYQLAIAQMEGQYRATVADTRKAYLSVLSQISQVEADRQSIKSNKAALDSIRAGYQAGTQTILDVLEAQKDLFSAEKDYARDRFAYLLNTLKLKQAAGTLSPNDLHNINGWLTAADAVKPSAATTVSKQSKAKTTKKN